MKEAAEQEKRARLKHAAKQRRKALETLAQAKKASTQSGLHTDRTVPKMGLLTALQTNPKLG